MKLSVADFLAKQEAAIAAKNARAMDAAEATVTASEPVQGRKPAEDPVAKQPTTVVEERPRPSGRIYRQPRNWRLL